MYAIFISLALIIILLFILGIFIIRSKTRSNIIFGSGAIYDDVKKNLKTGDIILFESMENGSLYGNLKHFVVSSVMGIKFKHSGIILKFNDQLYLMECCRYRQAGYKYATYINKNNDMVPNFSDKPGGVRIIKLDDILREYTREYKGRFCVKYINEPIPNELILKEFKKYANVKFGNLHKVLSKGLLDIFLSVGPGDSDFHDTMVCCQFTHKLLLDCNVIKDNISSSVFWPFYYYNGIFDDLTIIKYSNPICFDYNIPLDR